MSDEPPPVTSPPQSASPAWWKFWAKHWTGYWFWRGWRRALHGSPPPIDSERQVTLGEYQVVLGIIAVVIAALAVPAILRDMRQTRHDVRQAQLTIVSPRAGESVGLGQKVYGSTPVPDQNHYLLVTTVGAGTYRIWPAYPNRSDRTFSAEARFGGLDTGQDDEYAIQVFTTTSGGDLKTVPDDATLSDAVKVRRTQPERVVLAITSPAAGAAVSVEEPVVGRTSLPDLNHYIVVTPIRTGTAYVQDERASVNRANGTFSGRARFGAAQVGMGEQFSVRVLATQKTLPAGPLTSEPDAISSNAVTVTRQK